MARASSPAMSCRTPAAGLDSALVALRRGEQRDLARLEQELEALTLDDLAHDRAGLVDQPELVAELVEIGHPAQHRPGPAGGEVLVRGLEILRQAAGDREVMRRQLR